MDFLDKIASSITNTKAYNLSLKEKTGNAIWYVVKLTFCITLLVSAIIAIGINKELDTHLEKLEKTPNFSLKNGQFNMDGKMPISIFDKDGYYLGADTGITDINLGIKAIDQKKKASLITKDKIISKDEGKIDIVDLGQYKWVEINKEIIISNYTALKMIGIITMTFVLIAFETISKLSGLLVLSLLSLLFIVRPSKKKLSYSDIIKLCSYSLTLPIILSGSNFILGRLFSVPQFSVLYFAIALAYFWRAANNINTDNGIDL